MDRTERQKLAVKKWLQSGGRASIVACTGWGKTRAALNAVELLVSKKPNATILVSVPTEILKKQWEDQILERGLYSNCVVKIINTIIKGEYDVDMLIIDEVQLSASESFSKIFEVVKYSMILCLTATFERLDGKEKLIEKYAPICDVITLQEAEANGWVSHADNYLVLLDVDLTEYNSLCNKFNSYFAYFGFDFNIAMKCATDWRIRNKFAKATGHPAKEIAGVAAQFMRIMRVRKSFIQDHPKKIEICNKILDARSNKKCITFSSTIENAKKIGRGLVLHSKQSKKINEEVLEKFNAMNEGVLCSSKACNQGMDIKGLSVGIIMDVNSSKITSVQRIGRCVRKEEGKTAEIFTLVLRDTQEIKWFTASNTVPYKTISESQLDDILAYKPITSRQRELIVDLKYRF